MIVFRSKINQAYKAIQEELRLLDDKIHYHKNILDTTHDLDVKGRLYHFEEYIYYCKIKDGMTGALLLFKEKIGD